MALINGIYVQVIDEEVNREAQISTHSVEHGIDITDTIKADPIELSLGGKIVNYTATLTRDNTSEPPGITAWMSLVKKDGTPFESMSFERLNMELLAFENGVTWVDTGQIQCIAEGGNPINITTGAGITQVKFEVKMPYKGVARIQNAYKDYCAFNIINKSTTGYNIQDYNSDQEISDTVLSNTYNGERGRVRTEFINYDNPAENNPLPTVERSAKWVIEQLDALWRMGALITYDGRNYLQNYQIKSFQTTHPNTIAGGADFTLILQECRTAINSYGADGAVVKSGSTQQIANGDNSEVWYDVQVGDNIYNLVAADDAPYKNLNRASSDGKNYSAMEWVMVMNPFAFSIYGDYDSLKAGIKILLGTR